MIILLTLIAITTQVIFNIILFKWYTEQIKLANLSVDEYYTYWQETEKEIKDIYIKIINNEEVERNYKFTTISTEENI